MGDSSRTRVALFGDSITVGQFVPLHQTWPQRLSRMLAEASRQPGQPDWCVSVCAVNGRTSREALLDMPYHIQSQDIDILFIQFGLNDCNKWPSDFGCPRVSVNSFRANIEEMIDRAQASGIRATYIMTPHGTLRTQPWTHQPQSSLETERQTYAQAIRSIKSSRTNDASLLLLDIETELSIAGLSTSQTVLPLPDGLHLNYAGHNAYASIVFDRLVSDRQVLSQSD